MVVVVVVVAVEVGEDDGKIFLIMTNERDVVCTFC